MVIYNPDIFLEEYPCNINYRLFREYLQSTQVYISKTLSVYSANINSIWNIEQTFYEYSMLSEPGTLTKIERTLYEIK